MKGHNASEITAVVMVVAVEAVTVAAVEEEVEDTAVEVEAHGRIIAVVATKTATTAAEVVTAGMLQILLITFFRIAY